MHKKSQKNHFTCVFGHLSDFKFFREKPRKMLKGSVNREINSKKCKNIIKIILTLNVKKTQFSEFLDKKD